MSLVCLLTVLLLEQVRPLPYRRVVHEPLARLSRLLANHFNAGDRRHGIIAWMIGVGGLVVIAGGVAAFLGWTNSLLAWLWNVVVLYMTMGFGESSRRYDEIRLAVRAGDVEQARRLLAEWRGKTADRLSSSEVARLAIEELLGASHRHLFGVLLCFLLLPGPCGAVLYRASAFLAEAWGKRNDEEYGDFGSFARQTFAIIDWLPVRLTAAGFAVVGDFEDAVYCWRTQADRLPDDGLGIVLASGAGALGVRLGRPVPEAGSRVDRVEIGPGDEADVDFMESAVGLVWRALVLWCLLLLLLGLASLVGG